jgi:hypothetical protein
VTPVDASRAGDTFGGAFTARLLADTDPRRQGRQPSFTGIESLNGVGHVTPDGNLPAPDTLRFGLDRQAEAADVVIAANRNGTADSWKIVAPTRWAEGFAYVTTDHLSRWDPLLRPSRTWWTRPRPN